MLKFSKQNNSIEFQLYNKILLISRNKLFYTKLQLNDTFQNRINLIFLHTSFLFVKTKQNRTNQSFKIFCQKMFDFIFDKIELNMREIGYGDTVINKKMKLLVKSFYNILLFCENYTSNNVQNKNSFLFKYLTKNTDKKDADNTNLVEYFDRNQAFCFDLSQDSVLKGDLNFNIERIKNL